MRSYDKHDATVCSVASIRWNAMFFLLQYIYSHDKNDTSVLLATHTSGMPCFFNYDVVILVAKTMRFVNVA